MSAVFKQKISLFWFFFGITLVCWVYSFWAFLSRDVQIVSDAVSFYEHLKFYIDNISSGVYPYWDPSWSCGSPNEFFLRRIGPFNPFLLLILIPYRLGLDYWTVFAGFITFYFFFGMAGFYRITLEIIKDEKIATVAFMLLSFSSLSTRVFDSYLTIILTPMIWFFYFGLLFVRYGKESSVLGMTFCGMLLMTTYIPFYFIVLVLSFSLVSFIIFSKESINFFLRLWDFIRRNPLLFLLCIIAVVLSVLPGALFFKFAGEGTFSLPLRHFNALDPHVLTVKPQVATYWAIPEDLLYSSFYLQDLRLFDFAVFYVPLFGMIVLFLGIIVRITRRTLFLFLWGFFLFAMGSPYLFSLYDFLQKNIFFFKYFRNLHFFLWLAILPLGILFIAEQLRIFLKVMDDNPRKKSWGFLYILFVHAGIAVFLYWQESFNVSTWITLGLSLGFFTIYLRWRLSSFIFCGLCFLALFVQPFEAYQGLQRNAYKTGALSHYDQRQPQIEYTRGQKEFLPAKTVQNSQGSAIRNSPLYFGTQWYSFLWDNLDADIFRHYTWGKFIFYDHVVIFDEQKEDLQIISGVWAKNLNVAFVPPGTRPEDLKGATFLEPDGALVIEKAGPLLSIMNFNANRVKLKTSLLTRKFLVFNDCYYPGWRAYINGKEVTLYRANVAFKGVWVPSGNQEIEFIFSGSGRYRFEIFLLIFYFMFLLLVFWFCKRDFGSQGGGDV